MKTQLNIKNREAAFQQQQQRKPQPQSSQNNPQRAQTAAPLPRPTSSVPQSRPPPKSPQDTEIIPVARISRERPASVIETKVTEITEPQIVSPKNNEIGELTFTTPAPPKQTPPTPNISVSSTTEPPKTPGKSEPPVVPEHSTPKTNTSRFPKRRQSTQIDFGLGSDADHYLVFCVLGTQETTPVAVEISVHIITAADFSITHEKFHSFVLPPNFDKSLQEKIEAEGLKAYAVAQAKAIEDVVEDLEEWLLKYDVSKHPQKTVIVGDGGSQFIALMKALIENSASLKAIPFWAKKWISLKEEVKIAFNLRETAEKFTIDRMMELIGVTPEREKRPNAWDRGYNLALITSGLLVKGCVFQMYENFD